MTDFSLSGAESEALTSLFGSGLSQNARLITIETAQDASLPEAMVVERFVGHEEVNALFSFEIDTLSVSTSINLNEFIGEEITLRLLQADGSKRAWHGYCAEASWLGADGGVARYRLRLTPFLSFLQRRRDSFIYQDKNVQDIITELFADYPQANYKFEVTQPLLTREICTQYRESDLAFLLRLLASEGLNWRFEHQQDDQQSDNNSAGIHAKHQLIIFDAAAPVPDMPTDRNIRFHRVAAAEASDSITDFAAERRVQSNAVTQSSWDFAKISAIAAEHASALPAGEIPALPVYNGNGERRFANGEAATQHSDLLLKSLEQRNKTFTGQGAVRQLTVGHAFTLTQHERYVDGSNDFKVLSINHHAVNNLGAGAARILGLGEAPDIASGTYRNTFTAVRTSVAIVPAAIGMIAAPTATGSQTAKVVGLPDSSLTTERDHRVKVQFAWQRGQAPLAGGLSDTGNASDTKGNAPGDQSSGTWVRVAEALAGPNWGSSFVPRIGVDVLVDFIEGDIDRPVIVAQLYNGTDLPPWSAGIDSDANHAGALSGMHSHNLDGANDYNQWQLDDTSGQLRMRLATSTASSQLNLGFLIAQAPKATQRGAYRGNGFELRSDAWGIVRGAEGILISTTARNGTATSAQSTQLDTTEAVAQLKGSSELSKALADAATHQKAQTSADALQAQNSLIEHIDQQQKGKLSSDLNGQSALKTTNGSRATDTAQPVEKFSDPIMLMESPSSINAASPASTALFAGEHLQWNTQSDTHWTAAHTLAAVSGETSTLFTHAGGIQAFAGNGPVSLQAHTEKLEILADKAITVISVNDSIDIKANQKIVLQAGQSSVTLEGGNITFACPGLFSVKGATHPFSAGSAVIPQLEDLPNQLITPVQEKNSLRWAVKSATTGDNAKDVDIIALEKDTNKLAVNEKTAADGRSSRQIDETKSKAYVALVGSGDWIAEVTPQDTPEMLEHADWMDWEAEE